MALTIKQIEEATTRAVSKALAEHDCIHDERWDHVLKAVDQTWINKERLIAIDAEKSASNKGTIFMFSLIQCIATIVTVIITLKVLGK